MHQSCRRRTTISGNRRLNEEGDHFDERKIIFRPILWVVSSGFFLLPFRFFHVFFLFRSFFTSFGYPSSRDLYPLSCDNRASELMSHYQQIEFVIRSIIPRFPPTRNNKTTNFFRCNFLILFKYIDRKTKCSHACGSPNEKK